MATKYSDLQRSKRNEVARYVTGRMQEQIIQGYRLLLVTEQIKKDISASASDKGEKKVDHEAVEAEVKRFFEIGTSKVIAPDELETGILRGDVAWRGGAAMNSRVNELLSPAVVSLLRRDMMESVLLGRIFNEEEGEVYGELDALSKHENPNIKAAVALSYMLKHDMRDGIILKRLSNSGQEELVRKCAALNPFRNSAVQRMQAEDNSLKVVYGVAVNSRSLRSVLDRVTWRIYHDENGWVASLDTTVEEQIKRIKMVLPYHPSLTDHSRTMLMNDNDESIRDQVELVDRMYEKVLEQEHRTKANNNAGTMVFWACSD